MKVKKKYLYYVDQKSFKEGDVIISRKIRAAM